MLRVPAGSAPQELGQRDARPAVSAVPPRRAVERALDRCLRQRREPLGREGRSHVARSRVVEPRRGHGRGAVERARRCARRAGQPFEGELGGDAGRCDAGGAEEGRPREVAGSQPGRPPPHMGRRHRDGRQREADVPAERSQRAERPDAHRMGDAEAHRDGDQTAEQEAWSGCHAAPYRSADGDSGLRPDQRQHREAHRAVGPHHERDTALADEEGQDAGRGRRSEDDGQREVRSPGHVASWMARTLARVSASSARLSGRCRRTRANRSATPPG